MDKRCQSIAAHYQLERYKVYWTEIAPQAARFAHMHHPCLHPAFKPARALTQPRPETGRGLLECRGIDHAGAVAEACEAHAEICVLGDVVGIPAADRAQRLGAEMIR